MGESREAALVAVDRSLGRRSLADYTEMAWPLVDPGTPFIRTWHIDVICEHLEAVSSCQIRNLCINIPPGMSKSSLVSVFWPSWEWVERPATKFISVSYDGALTLRDAGKARAIVESDWYRARWGDSFVLPPDQAAGNYTNTAGGWNYSSSIRGRVTGRHCDIFKVDDPNKPLTVDKTELDRTEEFWRGTMPTRFRDLTSSRKVVVMQRLHERDLSAICEADGFEMLRLPMRFEAKACSYTKIGGDPRTDEGELLCPERVPEEALLELENAMRSLGGNRNVAAQLQQRPVPAGGGTFKRVDFRYWTPQGGDLEGTDTKRLPAKPDQQCQSWDCAFKDTDGSDYVCGQLWWRSGPDFFLLWQMWAHMGFADTCAAILAMTARFPKCQAKLIEDKANGSAVIETLKKRLSGIVEVQPEGGKEARANAVTGLYEGHNVYFPHPSMPGYEWVGGLEDELLSFPAGRHDDRVDASTQALNYMFQRKSRLKEAMAKIKAGRGLLGAVH